MLYSPARHFADEPMKIRFVRQRYDISDVFHNAAISRAFELRHCDTPPRQAELIASTPYFQLPFFLTPPPRR